MSGIDFFRILKNKQKKKLKLFNNKLKLLNSYFRLLLKVIQITLHELLCSKFNIRNRTILYIIMRYINNGKRTPKAYFIIVQSQLFR
jgi:hypothetical protein